MFQNNFVDIHLFNNVQKILIVTKIIKMSTFYRLIIPFNHVCGAYLDLHATKEWGGDEVDAPEKVSINYMRSLNDQKLSSSPCFKNTNNI